MSSLVALVRGSGDVGSAVAYALFAAGHRPVLCDRPAPSHPRRGMAFTDAHYEGVCELDGTLAKRAGSEDDLRRMLACGRAIPVTELAFAQALAAVRPELIVDARMRKRSEPETQRGLAPLTIGLGPRFVAGASTDVVIETAWGDRLGHVIGSGSALEQAGDPQPIAGVSRDRFVYAPAEGWFRTTLGIGTPVTAGQSVGWIGDTPLLAPLAGRLRGLAHDGAWVEVGAKVVEVDPRGPDAMVRGRGERPRRIADGVLRALGERGA
jgi:xanthine dehydrogenase accessory factor